MNRPGVLGMVRDIQVIARWQDVRPRQLRGRTVVVIDVLRWSTVVIAALEGGAAGVEAFATPEEAMARAHELGRDRTFLGGERGNLRLPGFDAGNSPLEYLRDRMHGRRVITTTTNGTQALVAARHAAQVFVAAYRNRAAVVRALRTAGHVSGITLLAAGQAGEVASEDLACAESIRQSLDPTIAMRDGQRSQPEGDPAALLASSTHAGALRAAGFSADVAFAAVADRSEVVPTLRGGVLVPLTG